MVYQPEGNEQEPQGPPSEADDIAGQMIKMLVGAFVTREGREPTPAEVEDMLGELTEERVLELMGGGEATPAAADADADANANANADVDKAGGVEVTEKVEADIDKDENEAANPFGFSAAPAVVASSAESSPVKPSSKRRKV
jgi:hypothetical protein